MKLVLKDFQTERVAELAKHMRRAGREAADNDLQAISLASPTGSGKTVMATAAIEQVLEGDDQAAPLRDATILWVSDQPQLNEQTRRKMLGTSSVLGPSRLIAIDSKFDQRAFLDGRVYFLNTQKLAKSSTLVSGRGDNRNYTLWETIANTVTDRPGRFFVVIDEAHRGMLGSGARAEANTIIQKFIKGSAGEIPPVPLIVGISATPQRFDELIRSQRAPTLLDDRPLSRTVRPVVVPPDEVRDSGLLKERIRLFCPAEEQPSDFTLLRSAAETWRRFSLEWAAYCAAEVEAPVRPVLVVQVEDGSGKQVSATDIATAIRTIDDAVGPLPSEAYAHAFQEGTAVSLGERRVRYLAPADIDSDGDVQVVFFKTSLNTGWDCPRAEVMMSFRKAVDATYIAQLVGRMVRTPLARRVESFEFLNTVALFLPHFRGEGLRAIIEQLTSGDSENRVPLDVENAAEVVTLRRAPFAGDAFEALSKLPSYTVPRARASSQVRRLMKFARLLANDGIEANAPEKARGLLVSAIWDTFGAAKDRREFKDVVDGAGRISVRVVDWRLYSDLQADDEFVDVDVSADNIDDLFESAGRRIGEGLHKAWWRERVDQDVAQRVRGKLEFFALVVDGTLRKRLERLAQDVVGEWLRLHDSAIAKLREARAMAYVEIRRLAREPEVSRVIYPETVELKFSDRKWGRHLYEDAGGEYAAYPKLNTWEARVIEQELAGSDFLGWLDNPERKDWSVVVPYRKGGEDLPLYPDFLIVRRIGDRIAVDLLDPHNISLEDAPAKAAGLAMFAAKHAHEFGRIELIVIDGTDVKRLDLTDEATREKVKAVSTKEHLQSLFEAATLLG